MKIQDITCFLRRSPVKEVKGGGSGWVTSRSALFVKVTTDDGIIGWGEAGQTGPTIIVKHLIEQLMAPIYIGAISGLNIALYDIMGKATGQPVHRLIGGRLRDSIPTYATGLWYRKENDSVEALV